MSSASPSPVKPRPTRRLLDASFFCCAQRPRRHVEHVVQHAHGGVDHLAEALEVEGAVVLERVLHEARDVDGAEAAAAVGRKRLFGARVRGLDRLAVIEVVVAVDAVEEEDARLGVVVRRAHDLVPQVLRAHLAVHPQAVAALVAAAFLHFLRGLGAVHELDFAVGLHGLHERVGDAHGDVEVGEVALVLGVDEALDVRVVAAQHAHLRAAARSRGLDRLARLVEDAHVGDRAARARVGALDPRALGADGGEVVAHAAAAAHRLGRFRERGVDAGPAVDDLGDGVAHGLHEAVDEGGGEAGAGGGVDAARGDEAVFLRLEELRLPEGAAVLVLVAGQGLGHPGPHFADRAFAVLGVLLDEDFGADFLGGQPGNVGCGTAGLGHAHEVDPPLLRYKVNSPASWAGRALIVPAAPCYRLTQIKGCRHPWTPTFCGLAGDFCPDISIYSG